jgi:hypothetical protein
MWKRARIAVLLFVLALTAFSAWVDRSSTTDWDDTLWVGIFPINADGSDAARDYIGSLTAAQTEAIEQFFAREAARYQIRSNRPVRVDLHPPVAQLPPALPPDAGPLGTIWWSLRLRWYANSAGRSDGRTPPQIRLFVLYHDPARTPSVPHSLGLQKGLLGVVYAFADRQMTASNNIVIAHEIMHTLGATDKYDLRSLAPTYPDGFAEPAREPRYPQPFAEIMAGRAAVSATEFAMPASLAATRVGPMTAAEIRWTRQ